ncbi:Vacuolar protein sorting-associated protein 62 [Dillenia turbinata]|uniref:Vacuolar protein sorting-associated protein 62 n=1 Tax=Dillenia turbinata TaxID=194707 RepID=A0AAN8YU39_9MAGN
MFGCGCCYWNRGFDFYDPLPEPKPFSLPSPLPVWPSGNGFGTGRICLGEIEVYKITEFESVWSCNPPRGKSKGVTFYKAASIPDGFSSLGDYCQPIDRPVKGYVLVAREVIAPDTKSGCNHRSVLDSPALTKPVGYMLVWNSDSPHDDCVYIWLPDPPSGYKAVGFVVTTTPDEPSLDEIRCVRADLTDMCEISEKILDMEADVSKSRVQVYNIRPCLRGISRTGVSVGTFFCTTHLISEVYLSIACLKNLDSTLHAMPNLNQIHALINHYGPTVYFHPKEIYMPSSVSWFFKNGALLYRNGKSEGEPIDYMGSNLPAGGTNDGEFWIDLPEDNDRRSYIKKGNLESAELYVHVKPALGGTFTDIAMWVFCPFNGPSTLKVGLMTIEMNKIGEHIGDWEHYTLRLCNFTGELWGMFFSQHSGGSWVDAYDLEFIDGNKPIVYSSKNGHASFPHPGIYAQGPKKLGIGIINDVGKSKYFIDSSSRYQIIGAEYLGDGVITEPFWLQYMREWGPMIVYDVTTELENILNRLPIFVRFSVETLFDLFPTELYGEEGPTGPKEKDSWEGDERC